MNNETSYFLFQIISFKKYFYVSLGNNFLLFLCRPPPLVVEAVSNCPVCPSLNPALCNRVQRLRAYVVVNSPGVALGCVCLVTCLTGAVTACLLRMRRYSDQPL